MRAMRRSGKWTFFGSILLIILLANGSDDRSKILNLSQNTFQQSGARVPFQLPLHVYPNPVSISLHIVVPEKSSDYYWIGIYDFTGRLILQRTVISLPVMEIGVNALAPGNYVVRVADRKNNAWSAKFVKV